MYENYLVVYSLGAFILDSQKRTLLVKKSLEEQIDAGLWVVPGGKVKRDEHIVDALKREVKEEVGLTVTGYQWIGEDVFRAGGKYFHAPHFLCKVKSTKGIKLEKKLLEYKWVGKNDLNKYEIPRNLKKEILNIYKNLV